MRRKLCTRGSAPALLTTLVLATAIGVPARQTHAAPAVPLSPYAAALNLNSSPCQPSPVGITDVLGLNPGSPVVYAQAKTGLYRDNAGSSKGWVPVNANIGGVREIAPAASNPNDVLLQHPKDLAHSTDGGATLTGHLTIPAGNAFDLVRAPSSPATLYGLSEAGDDSNGNAPGTVFRSNDTGITWTQVYTGGVNSYGANGLSTPVVAPNDANTVAMIEDAYHGGGIDLTVDGGGHWTNPNPSGDSNGLQAPVIVTFNPANAREMWVEDTSWQGFPGGSLVHSTDGGNSWVGVSAGLSGQREARAIAVDPGGRVYVSLAGKATGAPNPLFVSRDGKHFTRMLPADNHGVGHELALVAGYNVLLTWDSEHPVWAISTNRPGGFDPLKDAAAAPAGSTYVAATHHAIGGAFLTYYRQYGGLRSFGLPLSEPVSENGALVQYFERARLVLTGNGVVPSPLGSMVCAGRVFAAVPALSDTGTRRYFTATHHTLSGRFLTYWKQHEGSLRLGAPISEPLREQNGDGSGRVYLLQYFADGRLEYHPELGAGHDVSLGLVGSEYLHRAGLR